MDIKNVSMENLKEKLSEENIAAPITVDLLDLCSLLSSQATGENIADV
jgi:hypothetical protein